MSSPEDELEVEVGRPTMPGEDLRPFTSLEVVAPPMVTSQGFAEVAATPRQSPLAALESVMNFTVPPALAAVAKVIALLCTAALGATFFVDSLPAWAPLVIWVVGSVSSILAGVPAPSFAPSKPLVPLTLVPTLLTISQGLGGFAQTLQPGTVQTVVLLVSQLTAYLAGKAFPGVGEKVVATP